MKITLDRIEGELAILDADGLSFELPVCLLPSDAREGSVLTFQIHAAPPDLSADHARLERLRASTPQDDFDL